ncbi:helix-turn-helix domain-containing protein [Robiginitalea sp. SC105]|uniref:AraC family transcriptional regulator n=1 Tax=Robiginitalea sp. SC105 TaxID=2762332 RepID=UPI00163B5EAC|nr:helix-turn-helix domain-containing protein [Robiginitalea sp. SC105]MBC2838349.1 AraC family transcriptional regulator [Robiginitalea sp. SC105]
MVTSNPILFTIICVLGLQAMILSGLIAFKRPRRLANSFLALLVFFYALMVINIVVVNVLKDIGLLHVFRYIQMEMIYGIGPTLYFYTKCITNPNFEFKRIHYLHFLPLLLEFVFYRTAIYRIGSDGLYLEELPTYSYVYLTQQWLGVFSILTYSIISLAILIKYQKQLKDYYSKIENLSLKWLQAPIVIYAGYHILWRILTEIDRFVFDQSLREYYFLPNFVILAIITCWIGFKGYVQKERDIVHFRPVPKNPKGENEEKDEVFLSELRQLMETEKPYLNPDLNLSILAESLHMKPRQLSSKINQNCNQNFYDLINSYRVEAFIKRLQSADRDKLSLLGHAYECGFYSKSTFNHAFKKHTQLTPSEYLRKLKKTS